jgi:hypothetical protein
MSYDMGVKLVLTVREEYRLRVCGERAQKRKPGPKRARRRTEKSPLFGVS